MPPLSNQKLVECSIVVKRVISETDGGAAIFVGKDATGGLVKVVAPPRALFRVPIAGEAWTVTGVMHDDVRHGRQLQAQSCRYKLPRGRLLVRFLAASFTGIGEVNAKQLWAAFGERLGGILSAGDTKSLSEVLSTRTAQQIVDVWAQKTCECELIEFLDCNGFDAGLATKLSRIWGVHAKSRLTSNPYLMLAFANWTQVDGAAMKLGIARNDVRRCVGAVEATLYVGLRQSHTLLSYTELSKGVGQRLGRGAAKAAIFTSVSMGVVTGTNEEGFQTAGAAVLERTIAKRLEALMQHTAGFDETERVFARVEALSVFLSKGRWIRLNAEQRAAVELPFKHRFSLLTGGAGVGKTSVLKVIAEISFERKIPVFLLALAGRAAQRLGAITGFPTMTIAKFLSEVRTKRIRLPINGFIIIDEASMIDAPTLYQILRYCPATFRLLLVGDPAQLPPIGIGLIFHRLVTTARVAQANLRRQFRQADDTGIPALAASVREHLIPEFTPFSGKHSGASFLECEQGDVSKYLSLIARSWHGDDWQILSATNVGRAGVRKINQMFHFEATKGCNATQFVSGEPVVHMVNDYERSLMNGALGRIVTLTRDDMFLAEFEGQQHMFSRREARDCLGLGYAISVHKAQGSQFKRVCFVVDDSKLLDHALIYTALTRAEEQIVVIGDRAAFERAVIAPARAEQRSVGFTLDR
ncbi:AAA family ATPase [Caballeronia sp. 15715]|uniref:AAA family ATPase n=1 Tax=Caballeronia sp. 15715 TaxID=3391030 RepID=UPI0039E34502